MHNWGLVKFYKWVAKICRSELLKRARVLSERYYCILADTHQQQCGVAQAKLSGEQTICVCMHVTRREGAGMAIYPLVRTSTL